MSDAAVAVEGLSKVFPAPFRGRNVIAVCDLNLIIAPGQIYGLLGPNGSGKSTTLKAILGLLTPTRGRVRVFGRDSHRVDSRHDIGFLPENPYFPRYLSGSEILRFYGKLCGLRGAHLTRRVDELLAMVQLTDARARRLAGYSKGMLQRIGLAQALIHRPRLVVLDEPTAGVDPAGAREIRRLLLELKNDGATVLLSSHLLSEAQDVCDRVGILANGSLVREGALDDLLGIANQTDVVIENAGPALLDKIRQVAIDHGGRVIDARPSRTTLERLFLDATAPTHRPSSQ